MPPPHPPPPTTSQSLSSLRGHLPPQRLELLCVHPCALPRPFLCCRCPTEQTRQTATRTWCPHRPPLCLPTLPLPPGARRPACGIVLHPARRSHIQIRAFGMAWRSSGTSNESLVANLARNGLVKSDRVKEAMIKVRSALARPSSPYRHDSRLIAPTMPQPAPTKTAPNPSATAPPYLPPTCTPPPANPSSRT